jgi:hypothetical protein
MARIDIAKPYETYLQNQVKNGLYRSITAAAEAAIKKEMDDYEERRIASVMAEVQKGVEDVRAGRTHKVTKELFDEMMENAKLKATNKSLQNA